MIPSMYHCNTCQFSVTILGVVNLLSVSSLLVILPAEENCCCYFILCITQKMFSHTSFTVNTCFTCIQQALVARTWKEAIMMLETTLRLFAIITIDLWVWVLVNLMLMALPKMHYAEGTLHCVSCIAGQLEKDKRRRQKANIGTFLQSVKFKFISFFYDIISDSDDIEFGRHIPHSQIK